MSNTLRTINLEDDLPTVEQAMKRLVWEVRTARSQKIRVLKIIHGYGSSGKGGKIRPAARKQLDRLQASGHIAYYVCGERLSIFDEDTRRALHACPSLRTDPDIDRHNNGVTLAVL